ncbi:MAG: hypothetical protein Q9184_008571, partial [Pyrenodesmia sp. 2 TL-2023]
ASTTEAIARLQQQAKDADPITLLNATVNHIRQAIRSEADIAVPWLRISGTTVPLYELADRLPLKRAVDDIRAALNDVLDLEFGEGRALQRDSLALDGSESDHDDSDGGEEGLEHDDVLYDEDSVEEISVQGPTANNDNQDNRDENHLPKNMDDDGSENDNASEEDGMDSPVEGLITWESAPLPDDTQLTNDTSSQDNVSNTFSPPIPQNRHAPHPPTPPSSSQKLSKKSSSQKGNFLSNLTPSRLLSLFLPSPSPTPTPTPTNSQQRPAARTPSPAGSPSPYHPNQSPRRSPTTSPSSPFPSALHSVHSLPTAAATVAADEEEEEEEEEKEKEKSEEESSEDEL